MNQINIRQHMLPIYLAVALLIMTPTTPTAILCIFIPLMIISSAIHFKNRIVGIIGLFLLYLLALPQVMISTMDETILVYLIFSLLLPSILLVSQILQDQNTPLVYQIFSKRKKPILISTGLGFLMLGLFYGIALMFGNRLIFSTENIEGQVLLLTGLSLIIFIPLLLKSS